MKQKILMVARKIAALSLPLEINAKEKQGISRQQVDVSKQFEAKKQYWQEQTHTG